MKFKEIIKNSETLIVASLLLVIFLVISFYFILTHNYLILYVGYFLLFLLSCYWYYDWPFLIVILIPFIPLFSLWNICFVHKNSKIKKYINQLTLNKPSQVAIVLASFKWFSVDYFVKDNYSLKELKAIIEYINTRKIDFSVYFEASRFDVFKIMSNSSIREVYFVGHGATDSFQLDDKNIIYYEDFNDSKYFKDFVHQVHCGTKDGIPLREYVVPKENQEMCFWKNKTITAKTVIKWFKTKTAELREKNKNNDKNISLKQLSSHQ